VTCAHCYQASVSVACRQYIRSFISAKALPAQCASQCHQKKPKWLTFCPPDLAWCDFNELVFCHITCRRAVRQQAYSHAYLCERGGCSKTAYARDRVSDNASTGVELPAPIASSSVKIRGGERLTFSSEPVFLTLVSFFSRTGFTCTAKAVPEDVGLLL